MLSFHVVYKLEPSHYNVLDTLGKLLLVYEICYHGHNELSIMSTHLAQLDQL